MFFRYSSNYRRGVIIRIAVVKWKTDKQMTFAVWIQIGFLRKIRQDKLSVFHFKRCAAVREVINDYNI